MSEMEPYLFVLWDRDPEQSRLIHAAVRNWWRRLHGETEDDTGTRAPGWPAGVRAMLRRAPDPDSALLTEGFRHLWLALPPKWRQSRDMLAWGCVAAVLADVRRDDARRSFAAAMGSEPDQDAGKPCVSELRFAQLQRCSDLGEFMKRIRRVLPLLSRDKSRSNVRVNVLSLADNILHWHREKSGQLSRLPERRLAVRWATDYFSELARYQRP